MFYINCRDIGILVRFIILQKLTLQIRLLYIALPPPWMLLHAHVPNLRASNPVCCNSLQEYVVVHWIWHLGCHHILSPEDTMSCKSSVDITILSRLNCFGAFIWNHSVPILQFWMIASIFLKIVPGFIWRMFYHRRGIWLLSIAHIATHLRGHGGCVRHGYCLNSRHMQATRQTKIPHKTVFYVKTH